LKTHWRALKVAVANVLDVFPLIDASKIISKIKLHLLAHINNSDEGECTENMSEKEGLHISLFAMQPFEPSDGCLALRKLMANGSNG
jgi:hypothetical protein